MSRINVVENPNPIEPTTELVEVYESPENKFRREWAEAGADYSWQVLKFLQGKRKNEISISEIEQTQTYARSTELEKASLRFVSSQAEQPYSLNDEDSRRLIERDEFLTKFVANETLGHQNWVSEIQNIPVAVRRAQEVDAALFAKTFREPVLFSWIWDQKQ